MRSSPSSLTWRVGRRIRKLKYLILNDFIVITAVIMHKTTTGKPTQKEQNKA